MGRNDNAQAVEIMLVGRVSTVQFEAVASKLEIVIMRHGGICVRSKLSAV
jgi:hypothetical protein